jgi:hypothetical protein
MEPLSPELTKLLTLAEKLCEASKLSYGHNGLRMTELLVAINEYELAKEQYIDAVEREVAKFNKYYG